MKGESLKFYIKTKISENISKTPEGFLLCKNVPLSHTGPLKYAKGEHPFDEEDVDEIIIKRSPDELFSEATKASFEGKDITIQHPDDFVNPENYRELSHGVMFNLRKLKNQVEVEGELCDVLGCDFLIKSSEAIELVEDGEREVSLGYDAIWELISKTEGTHSKIRGNHCAIVQAGRAGKYCAITDSKKGEESMTKEIADKFKKMFGKTVDEAVSEKEKEEEQKAKDAEEAAKKEAEEKEKASDEKVESLSKDVAELKSMVGDLVAALKKGDKSEDEEESEDEDEVEEVTADEDEEESEDESEGEEAEDSDEEDEKASKKVGDAARVEILAPGMDGKKKDVKLEALKAAYKTADGKKVIDTLTGKKDLSKLSKDGVEAVFNAAAEMLKSKRAEDYTSARTLTIDSFPSLKGKGAMTADEINKLNAEHYGKK